VNSASLVGLDIGSTAIKIVQLKQSQQSLSLEGFGVQQVPVFTDRDGPRHQHNWLLNAIKDLFSTCDIHQKNVAVSLSGASVIIKRIYLPPMKVQEVEGYLTWEGSQHVPFEMDEVCWDYHPILTQGPQSSVNEVRSVFLFAAKRKAVEDLQRVVLEAGLRPVVFDVNVVALSNMYVMTHASKIDGLVLLVNIEEQHLNMSVMSQEMVVWMRDVPIRRSEYGETFPQSENGVEDIIGEVKRVIEYLAGDEHLQPIQKVIFYGDLRELPDLHRRVQADLGLIAELGNPFQGINIGTTQTKNHQVRELSSLAAISVGLAGRTRGDR
jgi:type IV pilus assembly protein PilM